MTIYHWRPDSLGGYHPGHIAVLATSEEEARAKARALILPWLNENRSWFFIDPADTEDLDEFLQEFEADLAETPKVVDVILCSGGE